MAQADIKIEEQKCIKCGACKPYCSRDAIVISADKKNVIINSDLCIECGHCAAVCPVGAISFYGMDSIPNKKGIIKIPDPNEFLEFIMFRRSNRHFQNRQIEKEKIDMIIEAGRYSPTASNRQKNRFIVLSNRIEAVRKAAINTLYKAASDKGVDLGRREIYRQSWKKMKEEYTCGIADRLFFGAPAIILIVTDKKDGSSDIDAGISESRMELQANTLGLGVCYIGFLNVAIDFDESIKKLAGVTEEERLAVAFATGYTDEKYLRAAPRKPANVRFL